MSLASAVAKNIKGPKFWGALLAHSHGKFFSGCDFMMALGEHKRHTKFEVTIYSRCRNIKGEPQMLGSSHIPWPRPLFSLGVILWWALENPNCVPNLKSLASAVAKILNGNSKILGSFPSPWPCPLFPAGVILWWALENPNYIVNLKSLASAIAKILKGNSKIGKFPSPRATPTFLLRVILWWALVNPSDLPNLKSLASSITEI